MKTFKIFIVFLMSLISSVGFASEKAVEVYHFDAKVTCTGDNCNEEDSRRLAASVAQAAIPPAEEMRPAWVAPVVTVVAGVVGAAAFAAADVVGHELTDKKVRPGEVVALGVTGGVLSATASILAFSF